MSSSASRRKSSRSSSPSDSHPVIRSLECKGCGRCVAACPRDVLELGNDLNARGYRYVTYTGGPCTGCASCYYTCPEPSAIEVHIRRRSRRSGEDT